VFIDRHGLFKLSKRVTYYKDPSFGMPWQKQGETSILEFFVDPVCTQFGACWRLEYVATLHQLIKHDGEFKTVQHEQRHAQVNAAIATAALQKLVSFERQTYESFDSCRNVGMQQLRKLNINWCSVKHVLIDNGLSFDKWAICNWGG
jgi:hypothetical protein